MRTKYKGYHITKRKYLKKIKNNRNKPIYFICSSFLMLYPFYDILISFKKTYYQEILLIVCFLSDHNTIHVNRENGYKCKQILPKIIKKPFKGLLMPTHIWESKRNVIDLTHYLQKS